MSARRPFTVHLRMNLVKPLSHLGESQFERFIALRKAFSLLSNPLLTVLSDSIIRRVEFVFSPGVVCFDDTDFFIRQTRNPAPNLVIVAATTEVLHEVHHSD